MIVQIYIALLGLFIGSFLNVVADRLYAGYTLLGRSKCDKCHHKLSWTDLMPIISYCLLKGKCRYCRAPISVQYPLVELFTSAVFLLTYNLTTKLFLNEVMLAINLVLTSIFIVMLLTDLRYKILPDEAQIAFVIVALLKKINLFFQNQLEIGFFLTDLLQSLFAGVVVALPLLIIFIFTKQRGMGFGDVKLAFGIGFLLSFWPGLTALYLSFIIGGVFGAIILLTKKGKPKTMIAFGPFLIVGTYLIMFFESEVMLFIFKMYGLS